jgi:hypothetical protein
MMGRTIHSILVSHLNAVSIESKTVGDRFRLIQKDLSELSNECTSFDSKIKSERKKKAVINMNDSIFSEQVIQEIVKCIQCTFLSDSHSSDSVLDLMVSLLLSYDGHQHHADDQQIKLNSSISQVIQATSVSCLERLRILSCRWMGALARRSVFLSNLLLPRLLDKAQAVRGAALHACAAFPSDSDLRIENILWNVHHDPSASNRCAALESLVITSQDVIPYIVRRLRDVHPKVRSTALRLLEQIPLEYLTPDQCASIIAAGLIDRYVDVCITFVQCASVIVHYVFSILTNSQNWSN